MSPDRDIKGLSSKKVLGSALKHTNCLFKIVLVTKVLSLIITASGEISLQLTNDFGHLTPPLYPMLSKNSWWHTHVLSAAHCQALSQAFHVQDLVESPLQYCAL